MMQRSKIFNTSSDFVYLDLRGRIVNRELKPAQRLLEVKIANDMGVSRTPVREALRRLAQEGLVRIVPNSGARVASPSQREVESAYSVREYLESLSVELACRNGIDSRSLERLEEALEAEEAAYRDRNIDAFLEANNSFHRLIAEAGKNPVLCEYIDNIMLRTYIFFSTTVSMKRRIILRPTTDRSFARSRSVTWERRRRG